MYAINDTYMKKMVCQLVRDSLPGTSLTDIVIYNRTF